MKILAMLLILAILLVGGCASDDPSPPSSAIPEEIPQIEPVVPPYPPDTTKYTETDSAPSVVILPYKPPVETTWISPGKVNIANFYGGARAEYPIEVHNGSSADSLFNIKYRIPSYTEEGYESPPAQAKDWIVIADATPVLAPQETRDILIVFEMPEGAEAPPKWEFWVSVMEATQMGNVHTELCSRWLIDMRE